MQVLLFYFFATLAVFSFSFVSWRHLREDYSTDQVFGATLVFLTGGLLGWLIFDRWLPQFVFWGFLSGCSLFGLYIVKRQNLKLFESLDAAVLGMLWFGLFFYISILVRDGWGKYFLNLAYPVLAIVVIGLHALFFKKYRRFTWYPSGKIGFIGAASAFSYFSLRLLVDLARGFLLSSPGTFASAGICFLLAVTFGLIVYMRSGREGGIKLTQALTRGKKKGRS